MNRKELDTYIPYDNVPLVISFIEMLRSMGYASRLEWDFWDFSIWDEHESPISMVKTVKNRITHLQLSRILMDASKSKIILVEGDNIDWDDWAAQQIFLAQANTGVYMRGIGWRSYPGSLKMDVIPDLRLKLSTNWRTQPDGTQKKVCRKCKQWKSTDEYYANPSKTALDPYRNWCKQCFRENVRDRQHHVSLASSSVL